MTSPPKRITDFDALVAEINGHRDGSRRLIGICGPPASGKSRLVAWLKSGLDTAEKSVAEVLPMDGFHLDNAILLQDGRIDFKGAPDTFDVPGFVAMHKRLAENRDPYVAVPVFDRRDELSRASARRIDPSVEIVLVEGNYLLLREPGWEDLKRYYDLTIRIDVPEEELTERLIKRWTEQKLSRDHIREKVFENDLPNGRTVVENSVLPDIVYAPVPASP